MTGLFIEKIIYDIVINDNITQEEVELIRGAPVLSAPAIGDFEEWDDQPQTDLFKLPTVIFKLNATAGEAVNLYIAGDSFRFSGEALGFSFDKQVINELGLYDPEIFQLVRHIPSNTFYFERVEEGTFKKDTQLAEHYDLSNPDDVVYAQLSTVLPPVGVLNGPTGEPVTEHYDEFFVGFSGIPITSTGGGIPENSRFIITDSDFDLLGQRNQLWGDDWFEIIGDGLFTPNADIVDFNALSQQQQLAIDQPNDPQATIYTSLGGDDRVTLPDASKNQLTQNTLYDPANVFSAGDGNDIIDGGDQDDTISGGDDNDTLRGNDGSDKLIGNGHNDQLFGGEMRDMLYGSDPLSFAAGFVEQTSDELFGEGGNDDLFGSGGGDKLVGGTGRDKLFGGPGDDTLFGGTEANLQETEADELQGGPGNDTIFFHEGDTLHFSGDGTSYTVDLSVLPFVGARINGPDGIDTLQGGALDAVLSFDNVDVSFDELGGVLAHREEIQKLAGELKQQLEKLVQRNKLISKIENILEILEDGVTDAHVKFFTDTFIEIALLSGGMYAKSALKSASGFAGEENLLKTAANSILNFVKTNDHLVDVSSEGAGFLLSDQDTEDALLAVGAVLSIPVLGPLGPFVFSGIRIIRNVAEWQLKLEELKPVLISYRDSLETFEIQKDAIEKVLEGLIQNMMDRTGQDRGWPCVRAIGDTTECGQKLYEQIKAATGDASATGYNFEPGADVSGTGDDDQIIDIAGAATINTVGGNDTFTSVNDTGEVNLGAGDDSAIVQGNFQKLDGGEGDGDGLTLVRESAGLTGIVPEGATVAGFENTKVVLDGEEMVVAAQFGGAGDENLNGGGDSDLIAGGGGKDTISGNGGNDLIEGGGGDDELMGGAGNDRIVGGTGDDDLTGNAGQDLFVMQPGGGSDTVQDFEDGIDLVDLRSFSQQDALQAVANAQAGSVILTFNDGSSITLKGIDLADFSLDDVLVANAVPTDILVSDPLEIAENADAGTRVATLSAVDADAADQHVFTIDYLRSGPGAEFFEIAGNDLVLSADAAIDFETADRHELLLLADDGNGGLYEKLVAVQVTNRPVSDIQMISGGSVVETARPGAAVASFAAFENPIEPAAELTLLDDAGGRFVLDGNVLRVADGAQIDFEAHRNLSVRLSAGDGTAPPISETFNIAILDHRNDSDVVRAYYRTIYREPATDQIVADYLDDEDLIASLYAISQPVFSFIRIYQSVFGRLPDSGGLDFWVGDFRLLEDQAGGPFVPESEEYRAILDKLLSYWLQSDEFIARFGANSTDETFVRLLYRNILNREPDEGGYQYWLGRLKSGDITREEMIVILSDSEEFRISTAQLMDDFLNEAAQISLGNIDRNYEIPNNNVYAASLWNDAPVGLTVSATSIAENAQPGTVVGQLVPVDFDAAETFSYEIVDPTGTFAIAGNELVLAPLASLDFETRSSYPIVIRVIDKAGGVFERALDIAVTDVAENTAPTDIVGATAFEIQENSAAGAVVTTLSAVDPDEGDQHTFSIDYAQSGPGAANFSIDGANLVLSATPNLDFEQAASHRLLITANDGNGGTFQEFIDVQVSNMAISDIDIASGGSVAENAPAGTVAATFSAFENPLEPSAQFTLLDDAGGLFVMTGNELRVADGAIIDFETNPSLDVVIQATDGTGAPYSETFEIVVNDTAENSAPTDIVGSSLFQVVENAVPGTVISTLTAVDQDTGDQHLFSIDLTQSGPHASFFAIDGDRLVVSGAAALDFETATQHQLTIAADDQNGGTFSKSITVDVTNAAITDIELISGGTIVGPVADNAIVATFSALENPVEPTARFTLIDNADGRFFLDGNQLRLVPGMADEIGPFRQYQVTLDADDGNSAPFRESFFITTGLTADVPAFYDGFLQSPGNTGFVSSSSTGNWSSGEADFWYLYLSAGESVTIEVERQENDFDPKLLFLPGLVGDPTTLAGQFPDADDEIPRPAGPFGDPSFQFTAAQSGYYTVVIDEFSSGPDDGGDGLFEYDIFI